MSNLSAASRRHFLAASAAALVTAAVTTPALAQQGLTPGLYQGYWHDGRSIVSRIDVYPDYIITTQIAGGDRTGLSSQYNRSGPSLYVHQDGHQFIITSPTSYTWINSGGGNRFNGTLIQ